MMVYFVGSSKLTLFSANPILLTDDGNGNSNGSDAEEDYMTPGHREKLMGKFLPFLQELSNFIDRLTTLYTIHYTLYTIHYTLYTIRCTRHLTTSLVKAYLVSAGHRSFPSLLFSAHEHTVEGIQLL